MRIAVWHNLPSGGGKRALYDQICGLVARGHHIEVWCPPTADRSYLPLDKVVSEHVVDLDKRCFFIGPEPYSFRRQRLLPWNPWARLTAMERHCEECAKQIHSKGFDLLFAGCCLFFHTPHIGRFVNIPSVVYLQEPNRPLYEALPELPWLAPYWEARGLYRPQFWRDLVRHEARLIAMRVIAREEKKNAAAFTEILVNSFFSRESVLRAFGLESTVCYLGVDTDKFINQRKTRESFVVSVGALIPSKRTDFLIEAVGRVTSSLRPKLVLVANAFDARYLARLEQLARGREVCIEVKLQITDADLLDTLNRARLMLYAPRLEPFGYAPLEGAACGLPVVAIAEGGVRETIVNGENGVLVDSDPRAMGQAIEALLQDDGFHQMLSSHAAEFAVANWSLKHAIDRLETELLAHTKKPRAEVPGGPTLDGPPLAAAKAQTAHK